MRNSAAVRSNPASKSVSKIARPSLKLITKQNHSRKRGRLSASVLLGVIGIVALIVTPMLINTQMAVLSYQITDAHIKIANLKQANGELEIKLVNAANPARITEIARKKGLVPSGNSGVINLQNGEVISGAPAKANNLPTIEIIENKNAPQGVPSPDVAVGDVYNKAESVNTSQK